MSDQELYNARLLDPFIKLMGRRYPHVDMGEIYSYAHIMPWEAADPSHWLSQEQVNRFVDKAVELTGNSNLAREAGEFATSPEVFGLVRTYILSFLTPMGMFGRIADVIARLARSSVYSSRQINSNTVEITVIPKPGMQEEKYQCDNRLGLFDTAVGLYHYQTKVIEHPECLYQGGACCRYIIHWQLAPAAYLKRARQIGGVVALLVVIGAAFWSPMTLLGTLPLAAAILFALYAFEMRCLVQEAATNNQVLSTARDQLAELIDTNYNNTMLASEIGQVISSQTTIDNVLEAVVKVLQRRLDFDRGLVMLANEEKTRLIFRAGFGHTVREKEELLGASFRLDNPESRGVFVKAFHEQMPYLVDNFAEFERRHTPQSVQLAKALGVKSFVCCPIVCDGEPIGVLAVDNLRADRKLMQSDKSLLMGIAPVIGVSIRNAELLLSKEREFRSTLQVLAASIDARDPLTAGHSEKVTEYAVGISDELKLGTDFRECVRVAALLHDYGKIGVPDSILKKKGRLSTEEYEVIKTHTAQTKAILERINFEGKYADVPQIAGSHHEKWNGNGYPQGLKGEDIPMGARIIAVADHFEAITSKRHYRDPMPIDVAIDELNKYSGSYFDPLVVQAFIRYYRRSYSRSSGGEGGDEGGEVCRIRHKRVQLETPVLVQTRANNYTGKTCDISLSGIYVSVPESLGEGLFVKIELMLPGQEKPIVASGRIAWVNPGDNPSKSHYPAGCGVELTNFDDEGDSILQEFVRSNLQETETVH